MGFMDMQDDFNSHISPHLEATVSAFCYEAVPGTVSCLLLGAYVLLVQFTNTNIQLTCFPHHNVAKQQVPIPGASRYVPHDYEEEEGDRMSEREDEEEGA
jgi:hypothetical protein